MGNKRMQLFISSVQKELQQERRAVKDFVQGDALLKRFFDAFLFEDLPASGAGRGTNYQMVRKRLGNGPNGS